ncbi:senescence-induced receptor-like serine/threonine-protein kinase [Eucalyptus grandis]|uniref:senescence-induced receptor-like serine/threonine-protein kinase n=1 Tax=Eucalyptus grandis TaxID=71139 RepID=UPI00192EEDE7|nr:senescence-induced receptor-like serine/threonine-protein kinase [Eucalyptus grandis]
MERSITAFSFALVAALASALVLVVQAQLNPGFISIDCGAPNSYPDYETNIDFLTDKGFIESGESMQISTKFIGQNFRQWLKNLRSFPSGMRNCYTLKPDKGKNNTYLIRASFWYAAYDDKNRPPIFDLYIDVNYWATVDSSGNNYYEIVYVAQRDDIQVCLVNIGQGVPFISALELRTLDNSLYQIESGILILYFRYDVGGLKASISYNQRDWGQAHLKISFDNWHMEHATRDIALASQEFCENVPLRYPEDVYDRIWERQTFNRSMLNPGNGTSASELSINNDAYKVPGEVLLTAQTGNDATFFLSSNNSTNRWIGYFHFAETQSLLSGQQREFTVFTSDGQFTETVKLEYLKPVTVISTPVTGSMINFSFQAQSGHPPPIINALEIFLIRELPNVPTALDDVKALTDTKAEYTINKDSWQGDPCVPRKFSWDGVNCSYGDIPRVISLNLSSSNLRGIISSSLSNLLELDSLDLSDNQLIGAIPEALANLPKLRILNLSGNKLNGSVPEALKRRHEDKTLDLSLNNNPDLCQASPCSKKKTKNSILVPVVASVSVVFVVICVLSIWLIRRKQTESSERTLRLKNRPFTYREVSRITRNFGRVIGEGGFGKVYVGALDNGTGVAVKMLSESSKQGYKEFQAEARLLMIVHHRNLVSLFGYCNESKHMALIYEYMANGNLRQHLSATGKVKIHPTEDHPKVLTWSKRLQIAVNAAQGLDYLHNGCKPPIIHRDLKTTNILLNEDFQAKIADFGLSRAFATENDSYVSTCPAGTPGYLDPEFQSSGNINKKSDVYSFGIVLFELITGRPPIMRSWDGRTNMHILKWLIPIVESGDIQSIMDPRLQGEFDINSAWKVVEIAMSCTRPTSIQRPDINHVLAELKESSVSTSSGSFEMTS